MTIDLLHSLVQSLSKSERRYCRLMTRQPVGDKGFLRLFDCLLSHETLSNGLLDEIARQFPGATLEPARKYLYRFIMQRLRQFEGTKRIDVRITQLLHDSQILSDRGLGQFSQEQLVKAQRLAEQHEQGLYAVLAARQLVEQWVRGQFDGVGEAALHNQHALIRQHLERTQTAMHHAALYETLLLRYRTQGTVTSPVDILRLNDLLLEEHQLLNQQKQKSFAMQQQHLHFQSAYFRMIGDGVGSLRVYRELDALFQQNRTLWAEKPLYYVQLLDGILADLRMLEQYEQMPYFIEQLRSIKMPIQGLGSTIHYLVMLHSLSIAVDQGNYTMGETLFRAFTADKPEFERALAQLSLPARTEFDLLLVRFDMGRGELSAGLQRLNRVLTRPARSLPRALYIQSRLMNLLVHARLGNADYLGYALRSVERKINSVSQLSVGEQLVTDLLRLWINGQLKASDVARVESFRGHPADHQLVRNLDLKAWIAITVGAVHPVQKTVPPN